MTTDDYAGTLALFGFFAVTIFYVVPAIRGIQAAWDRSTKADLLAMIERGILSKELQDRARAIVGEIPTGRDDI